MNQHELIEKIDKIETYDEFIEMNKYLREQLLKHGFECFENFHEIYQHEHNKQNELRKKFNIKVSKFSY
jgi:hypothetical protein